MKYKAKHEPDCCYFLVDLITEECLAQLNKVFGTKHTKEEIRKRIKVIRQQEDPAFWKRLMETKPGFDKEANG